MKKGSGELYGIISWIPDLPIAQIFFIDRCEVLIVMQSF